MHNESSKKKFYITTPIYYATAAPHLGTLYSTILADACARWHKMCGEDVYFLTGTDEFGQKVFEAAQNAQIAPQAFVDSFIQNYKDLWQSYQIAYSQFMRTTNEFHIKAVQSWLKKLLHQGDIYKGEYSGWYCLPCETYVTEKDSAAFTDKPFCASCQRETKKISEVSYFFKLSAYQDRLLDFYKNHPDFIIPQERYAEVISFVKSGLQDISISRSTLTWGVPFPDDDSHVTYVWADALNNYITAIGYAQDDKKDMFAQWWPADMHVMGKDIMRFHAIYWPAFLMAAQLPLPHHLLVHGWIKVGDHKMSKSRGNSIDPQHLLTTYGSDEVRYYLLKQLAITQDGQFSVEDLEQKITSDLANDLGNLLNRLLILAEKNNCTTIIPGTITDAEKQLQMLLQSIIKDVQHYMNVGYFHMALSRIWHFVAATNSYFHTQEPWKVAQHDKERFMAIVHTATESLFAIATLVWPFMPHKMELLLRALGRSQDFSKDCITALLQEPWNKTFTLQKTENLFKKHEPIIKQEEKTMTETSETLNTKTEIAIEDFLKIELRVGIIQACTKVANSDKLLRLEVNFGTEGKRVIFSGIQKMYAPEDLLQKQAVFVYNLKPRKMMGEFSHGMLLAIGNDPEHFSIVIPEKTVLTGSLLR